MLSFVAMCVMFDDKFCLFLLMIQCFIYEGSLSRQDESTLQPFIDVFLSVDISVNA